MFKKLFELCAIKLWWNQLSQAHKQYLEQQPVWHDQDLHRAMIFGIIIGFIFGFIAGVN